MTGSHILNLATDFPKLMARQVIQPLRLALRGSLEHPKTQQEMADLVNGALTHEIRVGYAHRFITLLFVTVGDRIFCRRYSYGEPS